LSKNTGTCCLTRVDAGFPLVFEHREDQFVGQFALDDLVLVEVRLLAHAETLHEARRSGVPTVTATDDPAVQVEVFEAEPQQFRCGFRGEPLAMVVRMEDEADFALAMLAAPVLQVQIADQLTGRGELDRDGEELPFLPQRRAVHSLGERGRRSARLRGPQ
jgi:hypothetical protein